MIDAATAATAAPVVLLDPCSGRALRAESAHVLRDDGPDAKRWPVVDGIAFLRADREALRRGVLADLDHGDVRRARARLLADQDPFAPLAPPTHEDCEALVADVEAGRAGLRDAMRRLRFGPVADYFAHRTCTPTYLSGLGLLAQHGRPAGTFVEIACGIGHFLHDLSVRGVPSVGLDLVYAKLWLARQFVARSAVLVCGDAMQPPIAMAGNGAAAVTVFCHDAFYFLPDKAAAAAAFKRLAGANGRVLVGHAHNASVDQGGVAGTPLTPAGYAAHFPAGGLDDDAEVGARALRCESAPGRSAAALHDDAEVGACALRGEAAPERSAASLHDDAEVGAGALRGEAAPGRSAAALYDDAEIGARALRGEAAPERSAAALNGAEAISIAWDAAPRQADAGALPYWTGLLDPLPDARLVVNPLLQEVDGRLRPVWPSERFAAEYRDAGYFAEPAVTAAEARRALAEAPSGGARAALGRRRVLVALPERG